jgi:outer membrane receptor for ferrienterochelin and colicin
VDALLTGARAQSALEPRLVTTYRLADAWQLHAGAGVGHQVAALPIALPGFNDVALERGLQRSISTEAGVAYLPTPDWRLESTLFYNHLTGLLVPDLFIDCSDNGQAALCESDGSIPRGQVDAYGVELFMKRNANTWLSGWLSYTLAWADGATERGVEFRPSFDVRHVGNLVLQWNIGAGFALGGRAHYRSGKVASESVWDPLRDETETVYFRYERRLPAFFRADAQLIYAWTNSWAKMRVSLEWMNLTLSREAIDLTCNDVRVGVFTPDACNVEYAPAIFFPSLGIRAEL